MTKYKRLVSFYHRLNGFISLVPQTVKTKMKKETVYNNAINLYNKLLSIYLNQYNGTKNEIKEDMAKKYDPSNLLIKGYRFIDLKEGDKEKSKSQPEETIAERVKLERQKADHKDLSDLPPLECDEREVNGGKGLKIFTLNKLLTKLPILLAQIKAENNSYKLKNEIIQMLYLLHQHNKITKKGLRQFNQVIIIMEENLIVITDPEVFWLNFDWPKYFDKNLKHEIEFIIKSNESLA